MASSSDVGVFELTHLTLPSTGKGVEASDVLRPSAAAQHRDLLFIGCESGALVIYSISDGASRACGWRLPLKA